METVNSVVNAASKAIWGEQSTAEERAANNETGGQEPLSGAKGAGNAEEPFDKGNAERKCSIHLLTLLSRVTGDRHCDLSMSRSSKAAMESRSGYLTAEECH
jgi:hypothetical protein